MRRLIYITILFSAFYIGCESDAEVSAPTEPEKIVVDAFLDPALDKNIIKVTKTYPVFREGLELDLSTTIVKFSDGSNEYKLPNTGIDEYSLNKSNFKLEYNKNYTISVNVSGQIIEKQFKTIDSNSIKITELKIDTLIREDAYGDKEFIYQCKIKFTDPIEEDNYYRIELVPIYKVYIGGVLTEREYYNGDELNFSLLSDKGQNGSTMSINKDYTYYTWGENLPDFTHMNIYIIKIDEELYKYLKSMQNINYDDIFSEPAIIYSNVPNGLGLIGSQQRFVYKYRL
jgi:hypothetical protein